MATPKNKKQPSFVSRSDGKASALIFNRLFLGVSMGIFGVIVVAFIVIHNFLNTPQNWKYGVAEKLLEDIAFFFFFGIIVVSCAYLPFVMTGSKREKSKDKIRRLSINFILFFLAIASIVAACTIGAREIPNDIRAFSSQPRTYSGACELEYHGPSRYHRASYNLKLSDREHAMHISRDQFLFLIGPRSDTPNRFVNNSYEAQCVYAVQVEYIDLTSTIISLKHY